MLALAALVPDTALLVPGAAGRATVLEAVRAAAVAAVRELVLAAPDRVVVVAPGPVDRVSAGPVRPSLGAAGIADADLGWAAPAGDVGATVPTVGASVAMLLLAQGGWTGPVTVVEVEPAARDRSDADRARTLRALGADLARGLDRVALVVAGSLSARNGPHAPHPHDERSGPLDAVILADLARGDRPARARLEALRGSLAAELEVTAWAPLQVLLGAAASHDDASTGASTDASVRHSGAPFGVTYAVAVWSAPARAGSPAAPAGGREVAR